MASSPSTDDNMSIDISLPDAIATLVEPCTQSTTEKPPFTPGQLIVMALAVHGEPLTSRQIIDWIVAVFPYYRKLVCAGFEEFYRDWSEQNSEDPDQTSNAYTFGKDHDAELNSYELPITERKGKSRFFSVTTSAARIYLQDILGAKPRGAFRFLDLPIELRLKIYKMALQFPSSGLMFKYNRLGSLPDRRSIFVLDRGSASSFSTILWLESHDAEDSLEVYQLKESLSLLSVNKQMFKEAVEWFYRNNVFFASSIFDLKSMLLNLAPSRHQHLRHIAFDAQQHVTMRQALDVLGLVALLPQLCRLTISLNQSHFKKAEDVRLRCFNEDPHDDFEGFNIPGLHILRAMRQHTEIVFEGECEKISANFKAEVEAAVEAEVEAEKKVGEAEGEAEGGAEGETEVEAEKNVGEVKIEVRDVDEDSMMSE